MRNVFKTRVQSSPIHGLGLFATEPIAKGTVLGEYTGRREHYTPRAYIGHYTLRFEHPDGTVELRNGRYGGNDLRYVNHSPDPNLRCVTCVNDVDVWPVFVVARDIAEGEELTLDYGCGWPGKDDDDARDG